MNNIFPWNWAFHLKCFAVLSVHLKSWVNLLYSAELSPVYIMQGSFHQLLKCKTFCGKREKAVLWLRLWPKGHTVSKYDFTQVVRARAALKNKKIGLRQTGELSVFSLFLLALWSYYTHNQTVCLPQTEHSFMAFQQIRELLDSVSLSLPDFSNFLHDHKA